MYNYNLFISLSYIKTDLALSRRTCTYPHLDNMFGVFLFLVNIVNTSVRRFCGYNKVLIKHLYRYDFHMVLFVFRVENNSINSLTFQICSNIFTKIVRI